MTPPRRIERGTVLADTLLEKPLPSSPDAERSILGGILIDNRLAALAAERLTAEDFYSPFHQRTFAAMLELFRRGAPIEAIGLSEEMKRSQSPEAFSGVPQIAGLAVGIPYDFATAQHTERYLDIIADKAKLRRLIRECSAITASALSEETEAGAVIETAQAVINDLCSGGIDTDFVSAGELVLGTVRRYHEQREQNQYWTGMLTGMGQIDNQFLGFQKGDLIIGGARPRVGKTSLLLNWAEGFSREQPGAVIPFFSLEMKKDGPLAKRLICSSADISFDRFNRGICTNEEHKRLNEALGRFADSKVFINDTPSLSPMAVKAKCLALKARYGRLDAVLIDFLQKMSPSRRQESFRLEIQSIARELKNLAKSLDVPVIVLSSLNRVSESRADKRPLLSDLAESNAIESEADIIFFLHRESLWSKDADPRAAEFIIAKNRNGPEATIKLTWRGEFTRFEDNGGYV